MAAVSRTSAALLTAAAVLASGRCSPVAPEPLPPPEFPDIVEALFLGSGPLRSTDCLVPGVWISYARGSTVTLVVASSIDDTGLATLQQAMDDVQAVIANRFRLTIERSPEADPVPALQQITSADVPLSRIQSDCSPGAGGCARPTRNGPILLSVRAIQQIGSSQRVKVHEFGHAVGLCHINGDRVPSAVMSDPVGASAGGRFSEVELRALRAVYESALEPGATRADFQRAGLIR